MNINEQIDETEETSMKAFADGDNSFQLFDWMAWEMACLDEERMIPPKEFKRLPQHKRCSYLKNYREAGNA